MKDKLLSMAPFFVIIALVLGWGFTQGWFSGTPALTDEAAETSVATEEPTPADVATPLPAENVAVEMTPEAPTPIAPVADDSESIAQGWSTYHGDERLAGLSDVHVPTTPIRRWPQNRCSTLSPAQARSLLSTSMA
mgnify:CR=1 FL=1